MEDRIKALNEAIINGVKYSDIELRMVILVTLKDVCQHIVREEKIHWFLLRVFAPLVIGLLSLMTVSTFVLLYEALEKGWRPVG